jgi:hypothetical protein
VPASGPSPVSQPVALIEAQAPIEAPTTERGEVVTRRVLLALLAGAGFWGLSSQIQGKSRPPETELVFLYHSDTKGEIEECG